MVTMTPLARRLIGSAAATVDRAVVAAFQMRNRGVRARAESFSHDERLSRLARLREVYSSGELISDPNAYFPAPPSIAPRERRVRDLPWGSECHELSWDSAFEPFYDRVRSAYQAHARNRTAHARLYRSRGGPRPAVIVVHGYMSGQWAVEERAWPIQWLNKRGLDVALIVLPFHGVRAGSQGGAPPFPGGDPRFTNEGFRQAVSDVRVLAGFLRGLGAPSVGIMGMSLGGYTAALVATIERDLAFAVPIIPLVSIADFARDQGRLGAGTQADAQRAALEAANWVVSPLARPRLVPKERVLVIAAESDRVTPIAHAERLAQHFDVRLLRLHGGHLVQTWRAPAFRAVREMLQGSGIV
jgi:pimeloyl-ACP methyl ester carboxylesterase